MPPSTASSSSAAAPPLAPVLEENAQGELVEPEAANAEQEGEARASSAAAAEPPVPYQESDWSSWDLGTSLAALRSESEAMIRKTIRMLHVRWFHASSERMTAIFKAAGVSQKTIDMVQPIVDSCKVCRQWAKPGYKHSTSTRLSTRFNECIQVDLLYVCGRWLMHAIDEATRFTVCVPIASREYKDISMALQTHWFQVFRCPKIVITDQEGGLAGYEGTQFLDRNGVQIKLKAKGSHAAIVERHHELWRVQFHRICSQAIAEGLNLSFEMLASATTMAKNCMVVVHGATPHQAVFGRTPQLLTEFEAPGIAEQADGKYGSARANDPTRDASRIREIALEMMVSGVARDRISRALNTVTRPAGQLMDLKEGDEVDIYRKPPIKEMTGWRGPGRVVANNAAAGQATVQWQGRSLIVHYPHLRRHVYLNAIASSKCYPSMIATDTLTTQHDAPMEYVRQWMRERSLQAGPWSEHLGWYLTPLGWKLSSFTLDHITVLKGVLNIASLKMRMSNCIGAQLAHGVRTLSGVSGVDTSVLLTFSESRQENMEGHFHIENIFESPGTSVVDMEHLLGPRWQTTSCIRLLAVDDEACGVIRQHHPDIPLIGGLPPPRSPPQTDQPMEPNPSTPIRKSPDGGDVPVPMSPGDSPYPPSVPWNPTVPWGMPLDGFYDSGDDDADLDDIMPDIPAGGQPPPAPPPAPQRSRPTPAARSRSRTRSPASPINPTIPLPASTPTTPVSSPLHGDRGQISAQNTGVPALPQFQPSSVAASNRERSRPATPNAPIMPVPPNDVSPESIEIRSPPIKRGKPEHAKMGCEEELVARSRMAVMKDEGRKFPEMGGPPEDESDPTAASSGQGPQLPLVGGEETINDHLNDNTATTNADNQPLNNSDSSAASTPTSQAETEFFPDEQAFFYRKHAPEHRRLEKTDSWNPEFAGGTTNGVDGVPYFTVKAERPCLEVPRSLAHLVTSKPCPPGHVAHVFLADEEAIIMKEEDELTAADKVTYKTDLEVAMIKEIKSWSSLGTWRPQSRKEIGNIIDARWVLRWKRGPDGKRVRGFKDLQQADVATYAGTATRWGQRLVCSIVANEGWQFFSADVGAAFLKGLTFKKLAELTGEKEREVAFTPPPGSEHLFKTCSELQGCDFRTHVLRMLRPGFVVLRILRTHGD